jgi:hypothetical protein
MFRTVPLSIIRSLSLHTQQWYMSYSFADSLLVSWQLQAGIMGVLERSSNTPIIPAGSDIRV